jgi:hypothetical protein
LSSIVVPASARLRALGNAKSKDPFGNIRVVAVMEQYRSRISASFIFFYGWLVTTKVPETILRAQERDLVVRAGDK